MANKNNSDQITAALIGAIVCAVIVMIVFDSFIASLIVAVIAFFGISATTNGKTTKNAGVSSQAVSSQMQLVIDADALDNDDNDDDDEDDEDDEAVYDTRIAGVMYNTSSYDIGGFIGYVRSEPDNPVDKNAIAIYRSDGKLIGHIAKDEIEQFREWSCKDNIPCIGYITEGDEVERYGKVKVIDTTKTQTTLEMIKYVAWLVKRFGKRYVPDCFELKSKTPIRTDEQWLTTLYKVIDKIERG